MKLEAMIRDVVAWATALGCGLLAIYVTAAYVLGFESFIGMWIGP